jgi:hypothetical protein
MTDSIASKNARINELVTRLAEAEEVVKAVRVCMRTPKAGPAAWEAHSKLEHALNAYESGQGGE